MATQLKLVEKEKDVDRQKALDAALAQIDRAFGKGSAMNRLSPGHMASLIMGTWFFASATGNFAAGLIAAATGGEGVGEEAGKQVVLDVYTTVGWYAVGIGVAVMVISPLIKRLMHLDTITDDGLEGQAEAGLEPQEAGVHPTSRA